jgi:hypothetical protein
MTLRFAAADGLVGDKQRSTIALGMLAGYFRTESRNVRDATEKFMSAMVGNNPGLKLMTRAFDQITIAGLPTESMLYEATSELIPGGVEHIWVISTKRSPGVFYLLLISPKHDFDNLKSVYRRIAESVRFE